MQDLRHPHPAFPGSSLRAELACKCGASRKHLRALYTIMGQAEDDELERWRDRSLWVELARRWRNADPERRSESDANELFYDVCKGLGLRPPNGGGR